MTSLYLIKSDHSTKNNFESDHQELFDENKTKYESYVHKEYVNLRAKRRKYQRRKRKERIPNNTKEIPFDEISSDLDFDEIDVVDKNLKNKIAGDKHVYCNSNAFSVELDTNDEIGPRRARRRIMFDKFVKKVI